jgi:hypothetical protein
MMSSYTVQPGDCFSSIAFAFGFAPDTLWNHESNAGLRKERQSPYVLLPGDIVNIPDKTAKKQPVQTGAVHRFRRKAVPAKLRIKLIDADGKPRTDVGYTIAIDDREVQGRTDMDGALETWIAPNATRGTLTLSSGEHYKLGPGRLPPVTTEAGIRARLHNLGFLTEENSDGQRYAGAIRIFQDKRKLEVTGVVDQAFRDALLTAHGS